MIGRTLSHYKIVGSLGKGGMGEVWVAEDTKLNRKVALKTLPAEMAQDPERKARFDREAQAIATLNHPNIVTIHSVEEAEGISFITMELVDGQTLTDMIPRNGIPLARLFDLAVPLADALSAAHRNGITHRDLKPDNVMVSSEGRVKVLDFGLAKLTESGSGEPGVPTKLGEATVTTEGKVMGTVAYMSPEQAEGKPVDARSDVFALGIMLYQMATGQRPFQGDTPMSTLTSILRDNPTSITELKPATPRHLGRLIQRCLAKDPERRYQTALDVRNELENLRGEVETGEIASSVTGGISPVKRPARRDVPIVGILTGVVAAIAIVALALVWSRSGDESESKSVAAAAKAGDQKSIAVLPFANMSEDEGNEFFSDGLAEELLNMLSKIPDLRVAARTSSFHFKGQTGNIAEIGRKLNVATILEGSVRRAANKVRVTAQLVNVEDGFHLWSETYDRRLDDIFAIQEDIATQVVDALKITLLGEEQGTSPLARRPTENVEAYDAYLLGQQRMTRRTTDSLTEAAGYFQKAIDLDPDYALAYVGLSDATQRLSEYGTLPKGEMQAKVEPLIRKALALDDRLGEAHASLGQLRTSYGDFKGAMESYERAIELRPNYAMAYMWYSLIAGGQDKQRGRELLEKSLELDPMSPTANVNMAYLLAAEGLVDQALEKYRHVVEIDPGYAPAFVGMAEAYAELGRPEESVRSYRTAIEVDPGNLEFQLGLGKALERAGRPDEALATYRATVELDPGYAPAYGALAQFYMDRGQFDEAVRWRLQAQQRDPAAGDAYFGLFFGYLNLSDETSARRWHARLVESSPDNIFANAMLAMLHVYHQEYEEADKIGRPVIEAAPTWLAGMGWYLDMQMGRFAEARERFRPGYPELYEQSEPRINSKNLEAAISLAMAQLKTGERSRAELLLRRCEAFLDSRPDSMRRAQHQKESVLIHAVQGRTDEALAAFRAAMDDGWRDGWWQLRSEPALAALLEEPRFKGMIEELRADADRMRKVLVAEGLATP